MRSSLPGEAVDRRFAPSSLRARRQPPRIVLPSDLCRQFQGGDRADWSTGVPGGRTCQTCRTSRTGRLVCSVPVDNNKISLSGSRRKPRKLVKKYRRQAEKRKRPLACCAAAQRYAPLQRRGSAKQKKPPSGGTSAATAATSRMLRGSATICATASDVIF